MSWDIRICRSESIHYNDIIMSAMASQITSLTIVYSRLFRYRSEEISKLRVTGFCAGSSPVTCEFPEQRASNTESISIWWRHHVYSHIFFHAIFGILALHFEALFSDMWEQYNRYLHYLKKFKLYQHILSLKPFHHTMIPVLSRGNKVL